MLKGIIYLYMFFFVNYVFSQEKDFIDHYLQSFKEISSIDGYVFKAENYSKCNFTYNGKDIEFHFVDTVPLNVFNGFVKNVLYSEKKKSIFPIILSFIGEDKIDSINISDVGILDFNQNCPPKIIVVNKREINTNHTEFTLLTDHKEGVFVELYLYDNIEKRILSYIPLFSGEKFNNESCLLLDTIRVSTYQTEDIKNEIITQVVNDGFNPLWKRKLRLNKDGYYEILWHSNPTRNTKVYEAEINDPDGYTNVREKPSIKSKVLFKIHEGQKFCIEEFPETKSWYRIYNYQDKYEGWIHKSRVEKLRIKIDKSF